MKVMSAHNGSAPVEPRGSAEDEWGMFDPQKAGMPALMRAMQDNEHRDATPRGPDWTSPLGQFPAMPPTHDSDLSKQDNTESPEAPEAVRKTLGGAVYTMESRARCPQCEREISTLRVLRVVRTQVTFTSTLPRKGYVVICPECEHVISAELSGVI